MSRHDSTRPTRRTVLKGVGAASAGLTLGLAGCSTQQTEGGETPDVLMIVGFPNSGVQIFTDYYANYDDDTTDILVTDGLQEPSLPSDVGNDMSNVTGTAPSPAGPGAETFADLYQEEYGRKPTVFNAQAYDASAVQILANLLAGENSGSAVQADVRTVANPAGEEFGPAELADAAEAAAAGQNVNYQGAGSTLTLDENGDVTSGNYEYFGFQEGGGTTTIESFQFGGGGGDAPQPEPSGSGSSGSRTVRYGVLMPESGDLEDLGITIRDAALLPAQQLSGQVDFTIETRTADTQTSVQPAIDGAGALVSAGFPSITGPASSEASINVTQNVYATQSITGISPSATSPRITDLKDNDFFFRTTPGDALQGQALAQVAANRLEASTASTLYLNDAYGQALQEQFVSAFQETGGEVLNQVGFASGQNSYTSQLANALNA